MKKFKSNMIKCKHCETVVKAEKGDAGLKYCQCKKVAIDTQNPLLRRIFPSHPYEEHYEELSELED
ncbi:hypothetical protein ACFSO7_01305 [Bacillus sp. CGMCC 1.16607]|uniref:DUF7695 domain-containing protein n=1 Tax=Bacillus sp. CGMCC 1.16607 TaxID=3351842 RepID=UPI00362BE4DA